MFEQGESGRASLATSVTGTGSMQSDSTSVVAQTRYKVLISNNSLTFVSLLGIFLGFILGCTFKYSPWFGDGYWTPRRLSYVKLPGEIFLNMLSCMYAPILISSLMAAVGSLDKKTVVRATLHTLVYILASTLAASALGAALVVIFNPGSPTDHPHHSICFEPPKWKKGNKSAAPYRQSFCTKDGHPCFLYKYDKNLWGKQNDLPKKPPTGNDIRYCSDSFVMSSCELVEDFAMDIIRRFCPKNIIEPFLIATRSRIDLSLPEDPTALSFPDQGAEIRCKKYALDNSTSKPSLYEYHIGSVIKTNMNLNGILAISFCVALAALANAEAGRPTLNLMTSLSECTLKMCTWIIWLSPVSVASMVAGDILEETSLLDFPPTVFYFLLTCVLALLLYSLVVLPIVYYTYLRKSPFQFYKQLLPVILIKLGMPSAAGTFPITIDFLETACHLDPRIVRLMIPFASQINSDGTALCTAVAVGYIAQLHGVELEFSTFLKIIFYTCMAVSIVPMGNTHNHQYYFTRRLNIAFNSVGMPYEFSIYVESINWVIDRLAAVTNALSDCVGCAIINHKNLEALRLMTENQQDARSMSSTASSKVKSGSKYYYLKENNIPPVVPVPVPVPVPVTTRDDTEIPKNVDFKNQPAALAIENIHQKSNISKIVSFLKQKKRRAKSLKSKASSIQKQTGSATSSLKSKSKPKNRDRQTVVSIAEVFKKAAETRKISSSSKSNKKGKGSDSEAKLINSGRSTKSSKDLTTRTTSRTKSSLPKQIKPDWNASTSANLNSSTNKTYKDLTSSTDKTGNPQSKTYGSTSTPTTSSPRPTKSSKDLASSTNMTKTSKDSKKRRSKKSKSEVSDTFGPSKSPSRRSKSKSKDTSI